MKTSPTCIRYHAFTLVELLTAISILAILASILISVAGRIRAYANKVECANNLRQIGMTVHLYANDNGGWLPGPLRGGQDARYPLNANNPQQLVHYLAEYNELNLTDENPTRAKLMVCSAFAGVISDTDARCYEMRIDSLRMLDGTMQKPFGYPSSDPERTADPPKQLTAIADPASEWMMQDLDQAGTPGYRGNPLAPETPVHGNVRNTLYFDAHVEAVDASPES